MILQGRRSIKCKTLTCRRWKPVCLTALAFAARPQGALTSRPPPSTPTPPPRPPRNRHQALLILPLRRSWRWASACPAQTRTGINSMRPRVPSTPRFLQQASVQPLQGRPPPRPSSPCPPARRTRLRPWRFLSRLSPARTPSNRPTSPPPAPRTPSTPCMPRRRCRRRRSASSARCATRIWPTSTSPVRGYGGGTAMRTTRSCCRGSWRRKLPVYRPQRTDLEPGEAGSQRRTSSYGSLSCV